MKILIPMAHFGTSGGSRVLSELATAWVATGHQVDILVPNTAGLPYFPTTARILRCNMAGHIVERGPPDDIKRAGIINNFVLRAGIARIAAKYDVVLANHNLTAWMVILAKVRRRSRFYYIQAYEPDFCLNPFAPGRYAIAWMSYKLPLTQIVNAPSYKGLEERPVVPCGINLDIFTPRARPVAFDADAPIILGTIGRTEPWKGTRYVLEAFELLHAQDPRYRLRIAFGNLPEGWQHAAAETVIPTSDADLAEFYRSLDILVAGTYGQNDCPHYPVLEAMACGVPTVNTGYRPANKDNSWLYVARDIDDLCRSISEVQYDPQRPHKLALARAAAEQFAWPSVATRMEHIFCETLLPYPPAK